MKKYREYELRQPIEAYQFNGLKDIQSLINFSGADRYQINNDDCYFVLIFKVKKGEIGYRVNLYDYVCKMGQRIFIVNKDTFEANYVETESSKNIFGEKEDINPFGDAFNTLYEMRIKI